LILLLGLFSLPRAIRGPRKGCFDVAPAQRLAVGGAYFGLLVMLAAGMWVADGPLAAVRTGAIQAASN